MRRTVILLTALIGVLTSASYLLPKPRHVGAELKAETPALPSEMEPAHKALTIGESELNYYLERHNVEDEGYEMVAAFANGQRLEMEVTPYIDVRNIDTWNGHQRDGTAITLDSLGRTIIGHCVADSLKTGIRLDSLGTYSGDFYENKASGHGAYTKPDGSYFEGHWEQDRRNGFGLELLNEKGQEARLRVGVWEKGRFQGERMRYTSERIYGIDIARYQHGKGRRPAAILWNKLRITHVGKRGSQNVKGTADYPVSFVFIKSTEGTSVRNKFYRGDYQQARKHGIHTGAYHFWSVRKSGAEQAQFFLKHTYFNIGDLPPVLDIEPSDAQIAQMGGAENMFRHIRDWLRIVEKKVGVKPVLYVNQMFVNKYLSKEEDLKHDYAVWIARYSEYKPDLKLTYWQLCPDGRVTGIQGDVDINVFNGYKSQFDDYLEKETIK